MLIVEAQVCVGRFMIDRKQGTGRLTPIGGRTPNGRTTALVVGTPIGRTTSPTTATALVVGTPIGRTTSTTTATTATRVVVGTPDPQILFNTFPALP